MDVADDHDDDEEEEEEEDEEVMGDEFLVPWPELVCSVDPDHENVGGERKLRCGLCFGMLLELCPVCWIYCCPTDQFESTLRRHCDTPEHRSLMRQDDAVAGGKICPRGLCTIVFRRTSWCACSACRRGSRQVYLTTMCTACGSATRVFERHCQSQRHRTNMWTHLVKKDVLRRMTLSEAIAEALEDGFAQREREKTGNNDQSKRDRGAEPENAEEASKRGKAAVQEPTAVKLEKYGLGKEIAAATARTFDNELVRIERLSKLDDDLWHALLAKQPMIGVKSAMLKIKDLQLAELV